MITLHWLEWLPVVLYLVVTLVVGLVKSRHPASEEQFILGGRQLTLPAFVMTLVTTWYGGILGVGEFTFLYGLASWVVFGIPYYIFALLFARFLAEKIQQSHLLTIPDQFFHHYGQPAGILATVIAFFITLPAPYILMIGFLVHLVTGWSLSVAIVAGTLVSAIYVLAGGFQAVVRTDKIQFIAMYGGFLIMLGVLVTQFGGISFLTNRLPATHFHPLGELSPWVVLSWFFIALWTFIDPGFYQRCYAARTPAIARKGIVLSVAFWFVFDWLTLSVGLYARAILPDATPVLAYPLLSHQVLPPLISGLFFTALFATIMSTTDSYTLLGAITLGHDLFGRLRRWQDVSRVTLLRVGLVLTTGISIALAIALPSVVQIWYVVGSLCIPPLLLPLLGVYYSRFRLPAHLVPWHLAGAFLLPFAWFIIGWAQSPSILSITYPLGIEPMFPGLAFSLLFFLGFRWSHHSTHHTRP